MKRLCIYELLLSHKTNRMNVKTTILFRVKFKRDESLYSCSYVKRKVTLWQ